MKKNDNPYICLNRFVLRTPSLPLNIFEKLTSKKIIVESQIKNICRNPLVKEAIYLASPPLSKELNKWLNSSEKNEKLEFTLLKYLSRMTSRCTPFGLFAGCTLGEIGQDTRIELSKCNNHRRHTRLDMNFLVAYSQELLKVDCIREQILFYPNSSIYRVGDKLRYIEYEYHNSKRKHHITAVNYSIYLDKIIAEARKGARLRSLAENLVDKEISLDEARTFINELVENQILVSELEPSVSGPDFLEQILMVLDKIDKCEKTISILKEIRGKLEVLDEKMINNIEPYYDIIRLINELQTSEYDIRYLFQTDLELNCTQNLINYSIVQSVRKGMSLLNKISLPPRNLLLNQFRDAFYERYEEREICLANALDVEIGIGYTPNSRVESDINPLVDDLVIGKNRQNHLHEISYDSFQKHLNTKIKSAINNNEYSIIISNNDIIELNSEWNDLPNTVSAMIEVYRIDGSEMIAFSSVGGSSATNLLGRFCNGDSAIHEFVTSIVDLESQIEKSKIHAEIVHLPESRAGNILQRPALRSHEIPYLANSILPYNKQIALDDIRISVKGGNKIYLRSKKEDKEIAPHLSNAHNYRYNSLPVYQFLSDMQTQGKRQGISFDLGPFEDDYEFIPQIIFENIILHKATWNISKDEINEFQDVEDDSRFNSLLNHFLKQRKIPPKVLLIDGDNELLINFMNKNSAKMLFHTVRNRPKFKLKEFLFDKEAIVNGPDGYYTHQIILSFYNKSKIAATSA